MHYHQRNVECYKECNQCVVHAVHWRSLKNHPCNPFIFILHQCRQGLTKSLNYSLLEGLLRAKTCWTSFSAMHWNSSSKNDTADSDFFLPVSRLAQRIQLSLIRQWLSVASFLIKMLQTPCKDKEEMITNQFVIIPTSKKKVKNTNSNMKVWREPENRKPTFKYVYKARWGCGYNLTQVFLTLM